MEIMVIVLLLHAGIVESDKWEIYEGKYKPLN